MESSSRREKGSSNKILLFYLLSLFLFHLNSSVTAEIITLLHRLVNPYLVKQLHFSSIFSFNAEYKNHFLNWKTRFQIILGIARGLQYLHEDSHLRIVHRDIKASNILLDDKFLPRIGDFGLARFFPEDQAYLSTQFAGTLYVFQPKH